MSPAIIGLLSFIGLIHAAVVFVPVVETIKARISPQSKLVWCLFLLLVPLIGVALFHYRYRSSVFRGEKYKISADEERSRSGTLAPDDD